MGEHVLLLHAFRRLSGLLRWHNVVCATTVLDILFAETRPSEEEHRSTSEWPESFVTRLGLETWQCSHWLVGLDKALAERCRSDGNWKRSHVSYLQWTLNFVILGFSKLPTIYPIVCFYSAPYNIDFILIMCIHARHHVHVQSGLTVPVQFQFRIGQLVSGEVVSYGTICKRWILTEVICGLQQRAFDCA